uniref:Uncharacterized protein n=1 Tax=Aegilops tauschii TaxID=37682 RepID=N1R4U7_AEGTA
MAPAPTTLQTAALLPCPAAATRQVPRRCRRDDLHRSLPRPCIEQPEPLVAGSRPLPPGSARSPPSATLRSPAAPQHIVRPHRPVQFLVRDLPLWIRLLRSRRRPPSAASSTSSSFPRRRPPLPPCQGPSKASFVTLPRLPSLSWVAPADLHLGPAFPLSDASMPRPPPPRRLCCCCKTTTAPSWSPRPKLTTAVHLSLCHFEDRDHQILQRLSPCTTTAPREPLPSTWGHQVPLRPVYDYGYSPSTLRMRLVRLHGPPNSSTVDPNIYEPCTTTVAVDPTRSVYNYFHYDRR